jgi:hypothetical protein
LLQTKIKLRLLYLKTITNHIVNKSIDEYVSVQRSTVKKILKNAGIEMEKIKEGKF